MTTQHIMQQLQGAMEIQYSIRENEIKIGVAKEYINKTDNEVLLDRWVKGIKLCKKEIKQLKRKHKELLIEIL